MNKNRLLSLIICCWGGILSAQTLTQARQWFAKGKYEEAKPVFRRLVKQEPGNANYNYWYGACCCETGEESVAEPYLTKAARRKVIGAFRYLAEIQTAQYRFDEAIENMEEYIVMQQQKKNNTEEAEQRLTKMKLGRRMLKGTEQVTFIDSFVVDKTAFLSAYRIGPECGTLTTYNKFFDSGEEPESILFQNELANKIYYAKLRNNRLKLYTRDRLGDSWSEETPLKDLPADGDQNYPFLLSDGVTFYYASNGEGSLGGYDLFVTRYNSETGRYLHPDNLGMPFNSPANDYMLVMDEENELGWFASDRNQPEGKVCLYVFIPNNTRVTFNYENTDEQVVRRAALIQGIASTWKDAATVRAAKQRLAKVTYEKPEEKTNRDFEFVIDDNTTYYSVEEFRSPKARELFEQWQQLRKELATLTQSLETKRTTYHESNTEQRQELTPEILEMEDAAEKLGSKTDEAEVAARNAEKLFISR